MPPLVRATAHRLFSDSPLPEAIMVYYQLDSSLKAPVNHTITGSDNGPSPSSKYFIKIWACLNELGYTAMLKMGEPYIYAHTHAH